jgi:regulator of protease activity HflC (stomatin/prohibitin superfamily)
MFLLRKFLVRKHERGLLFKNGDFVNFLEPGTYLFFDPLRKIQVELYDLSIPEFSHRLTHFFIKEYADAIERYFTVVELSPQQVALIYQNGQLTNILPPATHKLYWKGIVNISREIIDIEENFQILDDKTLQLLHPYQNDRLLKQASDFIYRQTIPENHIGLLYVDGQCTKTLPPGLHAYWQFNRTINIEIWDTRLQTIEVCGQEILSLDKISLRINLSASYFLKDIPLAISKLARPNEYLYQELQFGLRAIVSQKTLDELLEHQNVVDESVLAYLRDKTADLGIEIQSVGVTEIILSDDIKAILNKVIEAEKLAQANLIKCREETAATRFLLKTAKIMENNPIALRFKELEMLEKVTEKIEHLSIYDGMDGLLNQLVKLK